MLDRLAVLVRIDARRPAAWLALCTAAFAMWCLGSTASPGPAPSVIAVAIGVVVAVMALGDAAPTVSLAGGRADAFIVRVAWPLAGCAVAALVHRDVELLAAGAVGILAGAGMVVVLVRSSLSGADAATVALLSAGLALAAGWGVDQHWPGLLSGSTAAIVVIGVLAFVCAAWSSVRRSAWARQSRYVVRGRLTGATMAVAVAGMVGWLLLAPELATIDLAVSLGAFIALAVPSATLGDGATHMAAWRRIERAAPTRGRRLPPGRRRDGAQAVFTTAAVLGWPPIVAAVVVGADGGRAWPAVGVVVTLAAAAVILLAVIGLGEAWVAWPDTQQAWALACCCALLVALPLVAGRDGMGGVFSGFPP